MNYPYKTEKEEQGNSICLDFDGVIHEMKGWLGDAVIPDDPYPGAKEAVEALRKDGYTVKVLSTRCRSVAGRVAVREWLENHGIVVDEVCEHKPAALAFVDDRAIRFESWEQALSEIKRLHKNGGGR